MEWKCVYNDWYFTEISSQWFNQQLYNIGSDNGSALERCQTIIWTNDGQAYEYIYASLGLNELTAW